MYDHDIVEEEVLLDWGKKVSKKYVSKEVASDIHAKAQPFLKWLQEAEEEETTEEEEDDDDLEIEYDDKARGQSLKEQESKNAGEAKPIVAETAGADEEEDDDSDVDIDNI